MKVLFYILNYSEKIEEHREGLNLAYSYVTNELEICFQISVAVSFVKLNHEMVVHI